jgi:hypothetical protein
MAMDKPIGVGDLVYVWKWHACGCGLGITGRVDSLLHIGIHMCRAPVCGKEYPDAPREAVPGLHLDAGWFVPVEWVRRIPPQEELEGKPTQEPTRAPALEPEVIIELSRLMFPL